MTSPLAALPRRVPRQQRGQRRVASLLEAAAAVMAEAGYEMTTMSAIAERAGASIGSLYQFFPNKEAVAEALRAKYIGEIEALWDALAAKARALDARALVRELVQAEVEFARGHPAFLALLDAPATTNTWLRRDLIRDRIARVLVTRNPRMSRARSREAGAVVLQIVKGMLALYARAGTKGKTAVAREFEAVLLGYLEPIL